MTFKLGLGTIRKVAKIYRKSILRGKERAFWARRTASAKIVVYYKKSQCGWSAINERENDMR